MFCITCILTVVTGIFSIVSLCIAFLAGILLTRKRLVLALFLLIASMALIYVANLAIDQAPSCKSEICSKVE
jgi:hypothetical protein